MSESNSGSGPAQTSTVLAEPTTATVKQSGAKKFKCTHCDKSFVGRVGLNRHIRVHTGDKPFKCEQCDKRFKQKGSLTSHRRIHTGEMPFACSKCAVRFRHKGNLRRHERTCKRQRATTNPLGAIPAYTSFSGFPNVGANPNMPFMYPGAMFPPVQPLGTVQLPNPNYTAALQAQQAQQAQAQPQFQPFYQPMQPMNVPSFDFDPQQLQAQFQALTQQLNTSNFAQAAQRGQQQLPQQPGQPAPTTVQIRPPHNFHASGHHSGMLPLQSLVKPLSNPPMPIPAATVGLPQQQHHQQQQLGPKGSHVTSLAAPQPSRARTEPQGDLRVLFSQTPLTGNTSPASQ